MEHSIEASVSVKDDLQLPAAGNFERVDLQLAGMTQVSDKCVSSRIEETRATNPLQVTLRP